MNWEALLSKVWDCPVFAVAGIFIKDVGDGIESLLIKLYVNAGLRATLSVLEISFLDEFKKLEQWSEKGRDN